MITNTCWRSIEFLSLAVVDYHFSNRQNRCDCSNIFISIGGTCSNLVSIKIRKKSSRFQLQWFWNAWIEKATETLKTQVDVFGSFFPSWWWKWSLFLYSLSDLLLHSSKKLFLPLWLKYSRTLFTETAWLCDKHGWTKKGNIAQFLGW